MWRVTATVLDVCPSNTSLTETKPEDSDTLYSRGSNLTLTSEERKILLVLIHHNVAALLCILEVSF